MRWPRRSATSPDPGVTVGSPAPAGPAPLAADATTTTVLTGLGGGSRATGAAAAGTAGAPGPADQDTAVLGRVTGDEVAREPLPAAREWGGRGPAGPGPTLHDTSRMDPMLAAAMSDPFGATTAIPRRSPEDRARSGPVRSPLTPLVSRRRAAELGVYSGAALMLAALLYYGARFWNGSTDWMRASTTLLATLVLLVGGFGVRGPLREPVGEERKRIASALLATGVAALSVGSAVVLHISQASDPFGSATHAVGTALLMVGATAVARTPYSETVLLGSLCWVAWVVLEPGSPLWLGLAALGLGWLVLGMRWASGRRVAAVAGCSVALAAGAALAAQPGAWPARAVLSGTVLLGLGFFLAGRANAWLALGAGAACALTVGIGADTLSPAPALFAGGAATMLVSVVALRRTRREVGAGSAG